jgi:hypothetical protein
MQASVGDWLIVKSHTDDRHSRRGVILSVHEGGVPPYRVKWVDQEHEVLFFPGPDAEIVTSARLGELDHTQGQRIAAVQASIAAKNSPDADNHAG